MLTGPFVMLFVRGPVRSQVHLQPINIATMTLFGHDSDGAILRVCLSSLVVPLVSYIVRGTAMADSALLL